MVVMYEDTTGTASLNTDLIGALSANNGSNFTTVTLSAAPNLSSNIKVAKSNKVTVNHLEHNANIELIFTIHGYSLL